MRYFFFISLIFCALTVLAQDEFQDPGYYNCGIHDATESFFLQYPEERKIAQLAAAELEDFTRNYQTSPLRNDDLIIIPVVFHIVHNYGPENISDAQVLSAIETLNADFRAQTPGVNSVVSEFQSRVADMKIEFRLARKDPDGNCTNGIVRTVHPGTSGAGENLKTISPSWGREKYLNIWVCRSLESGAAGYSILPSNVNGPFGALQDGIVMTHNYVGNIGTSTSTLSHSLSHEVGHWANLHHTWGPSNDPGLPENCQQDDGVLDTPNTIGWTTCNLNGESCGSLDNVENFMEYAYCMKMFTNGQKNRLRAAMNSNIAQRKNLFTPANLEATGVLDEETICKADFYAVGERVICVGGEVEFKDLSYNGVTSLEWSFPGGNPSTSTENSPTVVYNEPGWYEVTLTASNTVSSKTVTKSKFIRVIPVGQYDVPFFEDFENISSFSSESQDWTVISTNSNQSEITWKVHNAVGYQSSQSAYVKGIQNEVGEKEVLMSPTYDLSHMSQNAVLKFKYAHARKSAATKDKLLVYISRNCGENWNLRLMLEDENLATVTNFVSTEFVPISTAQWAEVEISNISSLFLTDQFRFKFEFISEAGNNIYIDKINLYDPASVGLKESDNISFVDVFPNPVKTELNINYHLKTSTHIDVNMYDVAGRLVKTVAREKIPSGNHFLVIDAQDLAPGIYVVKLATKDANVSRKVIVQ